MYAVCTCPLCKGKFAESVCIECIESQVFETEADAKQYILKNVKIKTDLQN